MNINSKLFQRSENLTITSKTTVTVTYLLLLLLRSTWSGVRVRLALLSKPHYINIIVIVSSLSMSYFHSNTSLDIVLYM